MTAAHDIVGDSHLLDDRVTEELADVLDIASVTAWEPSPEDEERVESYKRALRYYRDERQRVQDVVAAEMERLERWRTRAVRNPDGAIAYLTHQLRLFSEATGRKKHDSPNGTLKWRKGRERVEIADPDAFCETWKDSPFVRAKLEPRKSEIADQIKATGEIPEGAELVRGDDTFIVDVPDGGE